MYKKSICPEHSQDSASGKSIVFLFHCAFSTSLTEDSIINKGKGPVHFEQVLFLSHRAGSQQA